MEVKDFEALIKERDDELGPMTGWYDPPTALQRLYEGKPVKLFNGSTVTRVEVLENFKADYDGDRVADNWGDLGADGEVFVVETKDPTDGMLYYFKITGWYDSWDNGSPDVFKAAEIARVEKKTVTTWKEV